MKYAFFTTIVAALTLTCLGYPCQVSENTIHCPKGRCLFATEDVGIGTVVEKFEGTPATHEYKAGMDKPIEERHIKWLGRDENNKDIWIFVTSNAAYINHSCVPNCRSITHGKS